MLKDDIKGRRINSDGDYECIQQASSYQFTGIFQQRAIDEMKGC